jgi:hypothetical protein
MSYSIPILLIAFNRPENTRRVIEALRQIRPKTVFVAADGPRREIARDVELCAEVRCVVADNFDWPCEIKTSYNQANLGCRKGVVKALDWFFGEVEEGVILEDDVVPTQDFFVYCEELLKRYRFDQRVGSISGNSFLPKGVDVDESYYFSVYTHSWGWATWRRAWSCYDRDMHHWVEFRDAGWLEITLGRVPANYWRPLIEQVYQGIVDTWDLVWLYSCWKSGFLTCISTVELVDNIGFGSDATHTLDEKSPLGPTQPLLLPLRHPAVMQSRRDFDAKIISDNYRRSWHEELIRKLKKLKRLLSGK